MGEKEAVEQLRREFSRLKDGYRRAIEAALTRVPVHDGVVSVRDIWIETSLPVDLVVELLKENGIRFPPHVKRVDVPGGRKAGRGGR
ncbi:hypothetical protein H5T52_04930 [Candidatus Bipolaricaulota bacterium]|nr:hypothetical protein [Candidatus Bipolaricaulota bacterium]